MKQRPGWRQPTQRTDGNWPFLYSAVAGRGLVMNVRVRKARKVATKKERR